MSFPCISSASLERTRTSAQCLLDAVLPKTPSLSESRSLILQFCLFDVNLGSTSIWCSLVFSTSSCISSTVPASVVISRSRFATLPAPGQ